MNEPSWRTFFRAEELAEAGPVAGALFQRRFGHPAPGYPRHFVLHYVPPEGPSRLAAYAHQLPYREVYLGGGMCVDESVYRILPKWLFAQVREEGGLATIVSRASIDALGDSPACFGYVAEPRAKQADIRTGFVETGHPKLMVYWRRELAPAEKARLIEMAAAYGPF